VVKGHCSPCYPHRWSRRKAAESRRTKVRNALVPSWNGFEAGHPKKLAFPSCHRARRAFVVKTRCSPCYPTAGLDAKPQSRGEPKLVIRTHSFRVGGIRTRAPEEIQSFASCHRAPPLVSTQSRRVAEERRFVTGTHSLRVGTNWNLSTRRNSAFASCYRALVPSW
jgi:hypothetical protein